MKYFIILLVLLSCNERRIDYLEHTYHINALSCSDLTYDLVIETATNLEKLDISIIKSNKEFYYKDLGYSYYVLYGMTGEVQHLNTSIENHEKAVEINPEFYQSWWDLSVCYYFKKQYQLSESALGNFLISVPEEYRESDEVENMKNMIDSKL
jgi:tetratricopeptide (TPR) repeat protein